VTFAELARMGAVHGRRVLVIAHRTELIDQAVEKLAAFGIAAGVEKGSQRAGSALVVVASVQTLRGRRLQAFARDAFALIVVDEAHHAAAASYSAILEHFVSARVLGVTATPDRADGKALGKLFASVAYRYEMRAAIADGWLAPVKARRVVVDGVDLADVRTRGGDLDPSQLAAVMGDVGALVGVAHPLLEMAGSRPTIVFGVDVAHARALAETLNGYRPGCARAVDGTATPEHRRETLADFRAGAFQFLTNCALFTEGFDEPSIGCVAIARPTKSRGLYTQMVGRGTRLSPGKDSCLVLDFTGTAGRHRLVGPADCLAGADLSDDVRAEIDAMLESEQLEIEQVIEAANEEVSRRRVELAAAVVARYRSEEIDPFVSALPPTATGTWATELASEKQRDALERAGLTKLPNALTKGEASRWLSAIRDRSQRGLATIRQVRRLKRYGVDANGMSFDEASTALERIASLGWRRA